MDWNAEDPRLTINKRDRIVVVAPGLNDKGREVPHVFLADVETKNGWSVLPWGDDRRGVLEDDEWPARWVWCRAPRDD